jgi:hypothetical protein
MAPNRLRPRKPPASQSADHLAAASSVIPPINILVLGDVNVDSVVFSLPRRVDPQADATVTWQTDLNCRRFRRPGGAWLLGEIVEAAVKETGCVRTFGNDKGKKYCNLLNPPCLNSLAALAPYKKGPKERRELVYRLAGGGVLGWMYGDRTDRSQRLQKFNGTLRTLLKEEDRRIEQEKTPRPQILVIYDCNNGYRDVPAEESLLPFLRGNIHFNESHFGVILWQMNSPLAKGELWNAVQQDLARRIVAVVRAEDLRDSGVDLFEGLPFEQTVHDFVDHLGRSGPLVDLAKCGHLVVRFPNGVLHSYKEAGTGKINVSFLPFAIDSLSVGAAEYGKMVGSTVLLTGAIAKGVAWALRSSHENERAFLDHLRIGVTFGAQLGTVLGQMHFRNGFASWGFENHDRDPDPYRSLFKEWEDMQELGAEGKPNFDSLPEELTLASINLDVKELSLHQNWNRVEAFCREKFAGAKEDAAVQVVCRGLTEVIHDKRCRGSSSPTDPWQMPPTICCPYATIGDMKLVDREEINRFTRVESLVTKYVGDRTWGRPLSIAVFGPPGSGKNFSIKQILKSVRGGSDSKTLEFNISQFRGLDDLAIAFHKVQDAALSEDAPLVVFDEFDSSFNGDYLGWLKYFLAPMQDGLFKGGESTYKVGRAIFVFAGGVHETFSDFYDEHKADEKFKAAKGPDFVSRLRGHLNIRGINSAGDVDELTMFRRAILLRNFIEAYCKLIIDPNTKEAQMDPGVIRAFLHTKKYEHGVRSMEAIVQMAVISQSRRRFQKSSVPASAQLSMHVDADEFLDWVHKLV